MIKRTQQETLERLQLEHELVEALHTDMELCLYYQPKIDMATGKLAGAEALLRWDHPVRGTLMPLEFLSFLPAAMALDLDRWVLQTICRDIQCWQAAGLPPVQVSFHVAARHLENGGITNAMLTVLRHANIEPGHIAVEIEESAMLHHDADGYDVLSRIRETGVEIHLDNFGADISSLKLLTRCPLDAVKIDRHLTSTLDSKSRQIAIVRALIDLGHTIGLKVVAEGVETRAQKETLAGLHCDQIQGLVISKPLPAKEFFTWMGNRNNLLH